MAYTYLGRTGVEVSRLAFGAMNLGARANADHADGVRIIHAALDAGITFLDTADVYSAGESETVVGKALTGARRDQVVLATKFHRHTGPGRFDRGNSRRWIQRAVEESLRRLGTDHIDLYQAHRPDPHTDVEDTLAALTDLVRQGKIRYFGTSAFPAGQLVEAQWVARTRGLPRPSSDQPPYSILVRAAEREVLPAARRYGVGVLSYSPLAGGWLSGRHDTDAAQSSRADRSPERFSLELEPNRRKLEIAREVGKLARELGVPVAHLAVAFVLRHPGITSAIIGPRTLEQLTGLLGADDVQVPDEVWDRIDDLVPPGTVVGPTEDPYRPGGDSGGHWRRLAEANGPAPVF